MASTESLKLFLHDAQSFKWSWNYHNCVLFAARAEDAYCESDKFSRLVSKHSGGSCALAYRRLLRSGKALEEMIYKAIGSPLHLTVDERAQTGDLSLVKIPGAPEVLGFVLPPVILIADQVGYTGVDLRFGRLLWRPL